MHLDVEDKKIVKVLEFSRHPEKKISDWSSIVECGSIFDIAVYRRNSHFDNALFSWLVSQLVSSFFFTLNQHQPPASSIFLLQ